jgi:hypothetical protein
MAVVGHFPSPRFFPACLGGSIEAMTRVVSSSILAMHSWSCWSDTGHARAGLAVLELEGWYAACTNGLPSGLLMYDGADLFGKSAEPPRVKALATSMAGVVEPIIG